MPPRNETAAPAGGEHSTLYVAIEVSRKSWVIGIKSPSGGRIGLHTLGASDTGGLRDPIERHRAKAERAVGRAVGLPPGERGEVDPFGLFDPVHRDSKHPAHPVVRVDDVVAGSPTRPEETSRCQTVWPPCVGIDHIDRLAPRPLAGNDHARAVVRQGVIPIADQGTEQPGGGNFGERGRHRSQDQAGRGNSGYQQRACGFRPRECHILGLHD